MTKLDDGNIKAGLFLRIWSRIRHGRKNPIFDEDWYLSTYEDVRAKKTDPWDHFIRVGLKEGRRPHPLFSDSWYKESYPDIVATGLSPFEHYHRIGQWDKRAPYIDCDWYLDAYPDVKDSGLSPAEHYHLYGRAQGRKPFNEYFPTSDRPRLASLFCQLAARPRLRSKYKVEYDTRAYAARDGRFHQEYAGIAEDPIGDVDFNVKTIAFYLPQMHPIPENDRWWGKGFTEWVNVSKAIPRFASHYQPRLPGELGFYDLRSFEIMERQYELAKLYGLHAFCFYYYWFNGKRLLERPLDMFAKNKSLDIGFCICWANENWTRRWDGLAADILIEQNHSIEDCKAVFNDWLPYISDRRYVRVGGKPVLLIYRPDLIPDFERMSNIWREQANQSGFAGLYVLGVSIFGNTASQVAGLDGTYDFPPHGVHSPQVDPGDWLDKNATTKVHSYKAVVEHIERLYAAPIKNERVAHPGALVGWDTEPRKPGRGDVFVGASPALFRRWLRAAFERAARTKNADARFVFINAWNEWAEGAYLEPDRRHGYAYLTALRSVVREFGINASKTRAMCDAHNSKAPAARDRAIMLHLFYYDLVDEFCLLLKEVKQYQELDLIVSFPDLWSEAEVTSALRRLSPRKAFITENYGRDVFPFLSVGRQIENDGYKHACKIHSKKSTHRIDGADWRKSLLDGLLSKAALNQLDQCFFNRKGMGIAASKDAYLRLTIDKYVDGNIRHLEWLANKFDVSGGYRNGEFIAGTMFWFDFDTFKPFFGANIGVNDFDVDLGQLDGSLAHAFERFFAVFVRANGQGLFRIDRNNSKFEINRVEMAE
ncbi:glycoside hydrolase family 99-like domain-containing protein [Pararhizobium sp. DWP1-1-3]|uniref:glycoside hydrolase family 99-like domain-containing protein n=1 Tax=Pararhizobium sp. DWP1-1-3 TaxID=2804652 RepID=UPI003CEB67F6